MIVKLNTNLINLFSGTYESWWEPTDFDDNGEEIPLEYNQKDLLRSISKAYEVHAKVIVDTLGIPFIKKIHFTGKSWSPREYNFNTDQLDFDLNIDLRKLIARVRELKNDKKFSEFLIEHFRSRDGFISFTPDNYDEIIASLLNKDDSFDQSIGAVIRYLASDESGEIEDSVREYWVGNGYCGLKYKYDKRREE